MEILFKNLQVFHCEPVKFFSTGLSSLKLHIKAGHRFLSGLFCSNLQHLNVFLAGTGVELVIIEGRRPTIEPPSRSFQNVKTKWMIIVIF